MLLFELLFYVGILSCFSFHNADLSEIFVMLDRLFLLYIIRYYKQNFMNSI